MQIAHPKRPSKIQFLNTGQIKTNRSNESHKKFKKRYNVTAFGKTRPLQ